MQLAVCCFMGNSLQEPLYWKDVSYPVYISYRVPVSSVPLCSKVGPDFQCIELSLGAEGTIIAVDIAQCQDGRKFWHFLVKTEPASLNLEYFEVKFTLL